MVKDGYIKRKSKIRILRDNVVIHSGPLVASKDSRKKYQKLNQDLSVG